MILVTGATGQLGQGIVKHLAAQIAQGPAGRLAVSVRDTSRAVGLAERGIEVRHGDFDQPASLATAFAGIERLVLISTDGPKAVRIAQHRNAIDAACGAGVRHIVYTSFLDADASSPSEFAQVHAATEADLAASGVPHTLLRNGLYADFLPMLFGAALESGVLHLPAGRGRLSYVSRDELAAAAAAAALAPKLERAVYELTGQVAVDFDEIAARVAAATGRAIRYEAVSEDGYAAALVAQGMPEWFGRALANMFTAVAQGRFSRTSNDFAALVGHPPKSLDCLIAEGFRAPRAHVPEHSA